MEDNGMTAEEIDRLARLYLECRLSRIQESELEIVLSARPELRSEAISLARGQMAMCTRMEAARQPRRNRWRRMLRWAGAAAVIAAVATASVWFFRDHSSTSPRDNETMQCYCVAYVNGRRLPDKDAKELVQKNIERNLHEFDVQLELKEQEISRIVNIEIKEI